MVGRDAEVATIEALVHAAREGRSGALIVSGEAGIGKTALLSHARARSDGALVLEATGSQGESHLAFAGLADLLAPVLGQVDEIPAPQAEACAGRWPSDRPAPATPSPPMPAP